MSLLQAQIRFNVPYSKIVSKAQVANGVVLFTDQDADDFPLFRIVAGNQPNDAFSIDPHTGQLSVVVDLLDYETRSTYSLAVSASDQAGASAISIVTISLLDLNEPPFIQDKVCFVVENSPIGTEVCQVEANDPDSSLLKNGMYEFQLAPSSALSDAAFAVDSSSGTLKVLNSSLLNYEQLQTMTLTVCAVDKGTPPMQGCGLVTVLIVDANDAPTTVSPQSCEISEISYDLDASQRAKFANTVVCSLQVIDEDASGSTLAWKTHSWIYKSRSDSCPFAVNAQGHVIVNDSTLLDYELQHACVLLVQATDAAGLASPWQTVDVYIWDVNERPSIYPSVFYIDENSVAGSTAVGSMNEFDPDTTSDGIPDLVRIRLVGVADVFDIVDNTVYLVKAALNYEVQAEYTLLIVATDLAGATSKQYQIRVVVNDVNEPPQVTSMLVSIDENCPAKTRITPAVSTTDPDGDTVYFSLVEERLSTSGSGLAPTTFGIDALTGMLFQQVEYLDYEMHDWYQLVVKVQDSDGLYTTANITITVNDVNEAPSVVSQYVSVKEDFRMGSLVGTAFRVLTSDPEILKHNLVTFLVIGGNDEGVFSIDAATGQVKLSKLLDYETTPSYQLQVVVRDHEGLEGKAWLNVSVADVNEPPTIRSVNFSIPENSLPATPVGAPLEAYDQDSNTTLIFSIIETGIGHPNCFTVNRTSGQLSLATGCLLDFELQSTSFFTITVEVSDGQLAARGIAVVSVTNINEPPVFSEPVLYALLSENSAAGTLVTIFHATDPDMNDMLVYWDCGQSVPRTFAMQDSHGGSTGQLIVLNSSALNFETNPTLWVDICVQDRGNLTASTKLLITLLDVDEPPYFNRKRVEFAMKENADANTLIGFPLRVYIVDEQDDNPLGETCEQSMVITDSTCSPDVVFGIDPCGQLSLLDGTLDYETLPYCELTITLSRALTFTEDELADSGSLIVQLQILNVNECPVFLKQTYAFSASENAAIDTTIGYLTARDPDPDSRLSFRLDLSAYFAVPPFTISNDGVVVVTGDLDYEMQRSYEFSALVGDQWGLSTDVRVVVSLIDSNEPPVYQQSYYSFKVAENEPKQTLVGTVVALDTDIFQNNTLVYSIVSGNDLGTFTVSSVAGNGKLYVNNAQTLDFERQESFTLVISAHDNGPGTLCAFTTVHIEVSNVNEAPVVNKNVIVYVAENAIVATPLSTAANLAEACSGSMYAADRDSGDQLRFTFQSAAQQSFGIDPETGIMYTNTLLDYETKALYSIQVTATDQGGLAGSGTVTVIVLDRNDAPNVLFSTFSISENTPRNAIINAVQVSDQDSGQTHVFSIAETTLVLNDNTSVIRPSNDVVVIDPTSGTLRVLDEKAFDYEAIREIQVTVVVKDDGLPVQQSNATITIQVLDINEPCSFQNLQTTFSLLENSVGAVGKVLAVDPDIDSLVTKWSALTYYIVDDASSSSGGSFTISNTGEISALKSFDYEVQRIATLSVRAVDDGSLSCMNRVQVVIEDVNEPPVISPSSFWVKESVPVGSGVAHCLDCASVVGASILYWDPENDTTVLDQNSTAKFTISSANGILQVNGELDFETAPNYDLTVTATDSHNLTSTAVLRVHIIDVNEAPVFFSQRTLKVEENSPRGTVVGAITPAYDPDLYDAISYDILEAIDSNGTSVDLFTIHSCDGEIRLSKDNVIDYEANREYRLRVRARDRYGLSAISDSITISVVDVNEVPTCSDLTFDLLENTVRGTVVGKLKWRDDDSPLKNTITVFEVITPDDNAAFGAFSVIQSGKDYLLVVNSPGSLNFEKVRRLQVWLRIADNFVGGDESTGKVVSSLASTCIVTIHLQDVNEPPTIRNVTKRSLNVAKTLVQIVVIDVNEAPQLQRNCFVDQLNAIRERYDLNEHLCVHVDENLPLGSLLSRISANDEDPHQRLYYTISSDVAVIARIVQTDDRNCDVVSFQETFNFEKQNVYRFQLTVTDTGTGFLSDHVQVVVFVHDVNEVPAVIRASMLNLRLPENTAPGTLIGQIRAVDPEGDAFTFVLQSTTPVADSIWIDADGSIYSSEEPCDFESLVRLQISSGSSINPVLSVQASIITFDNVSVPIQLEIMIVDVTEPPLFKYKDYKMAVHELAESNSLIGIISAFDVDFNDSVVYSMASKDLDGTIVTDLFTLDVSSGALSLLHKGILDVRQKSFYNLTMQATDSTGLLDTTTVSVVVLNDNYPPVCSMLHCWVAENSPAIQIGLPGTEGPCQVSVQDADAEQPHVFFRVSNDNDPFTIDYGTGTIHYGAGRAYANFEVQDEYRIRYQASDVPAAGTASLSCSSEVVITVIDVNEAPEFTSGVSTLSVIENSVAGTTVGKVDASDEDTGDVLQFTLLSAYSPFILDKDTGLLQVANASLLNFEMQSSMVILVSVTDQLGLQALANISVAVLNTNDPPVLDTTVLYANEFAASTSSNALQALGSLHCVDEDYGDALRFKLLTWNSKFIIESTSGLIYARADLLDFETKREYVLDIRCTDGLTESSALATVIVVNINESPIVRNYTIRVRENITPGSLVGKIDAFDPELNDAEYLTIASAEFNTQTVFVQPLQKAAKCFSTSDDFEWISFSEHLKAKAFVVAGPSTAPVTNLTLRFASSGSMFVLLDQEAIDVPKWITDGGFSLLAGESVVAQSSSSKLEFHIYIKSVAAEFFTVPSLSDASSSSGAFYILGAYPSPLEYFLHGASSSSFEINNSGELSLSSSAEPFDFEAVLSKSQPLTLFVGVMDHFGLTSEATLTVYVDDVNEKPVLESTSFQISENPGIGAWIGTLIAVDPDAGDFVTYSLAYDSSLVLVSPAGNVSVLNASAFDYELKGSIMVKVRATDAQGLYDEQDVKIVIMDVNEAPVFSSSSYYLTVLENTAIGTAFGMPLHATDQDVGQTNSLRYELVAKDAGGFPFRLEGCSGQLIVQNENLDYEMTNVYVFEVRATDPGYPTALSATAQVTVRIVDVNEPPVFGNMPKFSIAENAPNNAGIGQMLVTDPDKDSVLTYTTNSSAFVRISPSGWLTSTTSFDYETMPMLTILVTASDNGVNCYGLEAEHCTPLSVSTIVVVYVANVNEPPQLEAAEFSTRENLCSGTFVGRPLLVIDPDGTVGDEWGFSIISSNDSDVKIAFGIRENGQLFTRVSLDFETKSRYDVPVVYSDGEYETMKFIVISVVDVNESPVVSAGQAGSIAENSPTGTTVMVVKYTDPDVLLNNVFSLASTYLPFEVHSETGVITTTRPLDFEKDLKIFVVSVRVCDKGVSNLCGHEVVNIAVLDVPEAPTMTSVNCAVVENTAEIMNEARTIKCTFIADDPDVNSCSRYEIAETSLFTLTEPIVVDGASTQLSLNRSVCTNSSVSLAWHGRSSYAQSIINYEEKSQHVVPINIYDATFESTGLFSQSFITVNAIDANDCPTMASVAFSILEGVPQGTLIGYPLPGKDEDFADVLSYAIGEASTLGGLIQIDRSSGQLSIARDPTLNELVYPATYIIRVSVTDKAQCTSGATVTITTANANFPPVWSISVPVAFLIDENVAAGTQVGSSLLQWVSDPDNDTMEFSLQSKADTMCVDTFSLGGSDGKLSLRPNQSLDYERRNTYVCTFVACDPLNACSVRDIQIRVQNVNEPPVFSESAVKFEVQENQPANSTAARCLSAVDPDFGDGKLLQYSLNCTSAVDCSPFSIHTEQDCNQTACARIQMPVSLNYEARSTYVFTLVAMDQQGLTATTTITIQVVDVNEVQSFSGFPFAVSVSENAAVGTVLFTVRATDPDVSTSMYSTMQYSLESVYPTDMGWIQINAATGEVSVTGVIDYEAVQSFTLTVQAKDTSAAPLNISSQCVVNVLDVQDMTIDRVELLPGATTLSTVGGDTIELIGTNIGFKQRSENSVIIKKLEVRYGTYGSGLPFLASNCSLVNGNTNLALASIYIGTSCS
uniref:Cadherin domain-containing protein n=1 Tax=Globisporangium ultimum (strain ATCC 200006 / CBS 805.95 / DAOM BR144) TaxID=431595 RepID=K3X1D1_GLOUD